MYSLNKKWVCTCVGAVQWRIIQQKKSCLSQTHIFTRVLCLFTYDIQLYQDEFQHSRFDMVFDMLAPLSSYQ